MGISKFSAKIVHFSLVCARVIRCQSINHMVHGEICELKNRTKEAKPEYFTDDHTKVYMKKFRKKFLVGYFMKAVPFHFHVCVYSAVARGGAGGARAPPVFFPKK